MAESGQNRYEQELLTSRMTVTLRKCYLEGRVGRKTGIGSAVALRGALVFQDFLFTFSSNGKSKSPSGLRTKDKC